MFRMPCRRRSLLDFDGYVKRSVILGDIHPAVPASAFLAQYRK